MKGKKLITLSPEVIDDIDRKSKEEYFNFSEWVETRWIDYNMTEKGIKIQMENLQIQQKSLKNRLNHLKRKGSIRLNHLKRNLTEEMKKELNHTKKIVENDSRKIKARLNFINNSFNYNLSRLDLLDLIEYKPKDL